MPGDFLPRNVGTVCSDSPPVLSSVKVVLLLHVRRTLNDEEFHFHWKRKRSLLPMNENLDLSDIDRFLRSGFLQGLLAPGNSSTSYLCASTCHPASFEMQSGAFGGMGLGPSKPS